MKHILTHTQQLLNRKIESAFGFLSDTTAFEADSTINLSNAIRANLRTGLSCFACSLPTTLNLDNIFRTVMPPQNIKINVHGVPGKTMDVPKKHKVIKGDTLYNIAKRYGVSIENIRLWNKINGENILLGQDIIIIKTIPKIQASIDLKFAATPENMLHPEVLSNLSKDYSAQLGKIPKLPSFANDATYNGNSNSAASGNRTIESTGENKKGFLTPMGTFGVVTTEIYAGLAEWAGHGNLPIIKTVGQYTGIAGSIVITANQAYKTLYNPTIQNKVNLGADIILVGACLIMPEFAPIFVLCKVVIDSYYEVKE